MICTISVAKAMALISFAVTAKLICAFVFAYAKYWFPHDTAHLIVQLIVNSIAQFDDFSGQFQSNDQ